MGQICQLGRESCPTMHRVTFRHTWGHLMSKSACLIAVILIIAAAGYVVVSQRQVPTVSADEFNERLQQPGVLLAKFGATWCGPCLQVDDELSKLAWSEYGELEIVLVDVDEEPELASQFGVRSIPHLILFRDGRQLSSRIGFMSHQDLVDWVAKTHQVVYGPARATTTASLLGE